MICSETCNIYKTVNVQVKKDTLANHPKSRINLQNKKNYVKFGYHRIAIFPTEKVEK